ncbi:TIGR04222 domain-containing membrane protein [Hymenobacter sp. IS2118]|uniref:TIGR04222 domain-containing membrane protein n=1 Tax=Hymenobacter sp. IS2118 TaxID=1505605 RepID=UPI0005574041|nr:TIGR04222 domain-containing membrane protein [Hymenobacter sp. IS2118]
MFSASPQAASPDLWAKLDALDLDGGEQLSFSKRLARDNGWSLAFARRVVLEYKKFVFLAATCGHPVTPSDEVDQAWHLHLVYTRSYWDDMCGQVLGFALHHGPTKGGTAEGNKFQDWYARTLQSYAAVFGLPPVDVWPAAAVRFGEAPYFRRVNLRRKWLLSRPQWRVRLGWRGWSTVAAGLLLVGCTARTPLNPLNWYGTEFLQLFWALCLTLVPLALLLRHWGRGPAAAYAGPEPTTYELVRLARRGHLVVESALAALVYTGKAELMPGRRIRRSTAAPPTAPYERAVWDLIAPEGSSDIKQLREAATQPNAPALEELDAALVAKDLLLPPPKRKKLDRLVLFTILALGLFGLAKLAVGISRDKPVGFLVLSLIILGLGSIYCFGNGVWATGRGARLLQEFTPVLKQQQQAGEHSRSTVALCVAFFGLSALSDLGMNNLAISLKPLVSSGDGGSSSDSGSGGSDGGDGGSGCGGCGGCGGD